MESEAKRRSRGPLSAPLRRLTRPSNGMPYRTMRASERDRWQAMKRGDTDRMVRPAAAVAPLDEVLVGEQRDGGQRAADALGRVLAGDDALFLDELAAYPERLVQHQVDLALGFGAAGDTVELHDDAVLRRVVRDGVADGRRDGLAGRLARHGRIGGRDDGAGLDFRKIDHRDFGRQDARDLHQVDVADAGCEKRVVESVEGGTALGVTGSRCSHRHLLRHSLAPPRREILASNHSARTEPEIFRQFTDAASQCKRKVRGSASERRVRCSSNAAERPDTPQTLVAARASRALSTVFLAAATPARAPTS